jgi:hypothetical protein
MLSRFNYSRNRLSNKQWSSSFFKKNTDLKNIVGRSLHNARMIKYPIESYDEDRTTLENLKILKQNAPSYPKCSFR